MKPLRVKEDLLSIAYSSDYTALQSVAGLSSSTDTTPRVVELGAPIGGITTDSTPLLDWTPIYGATSYLLSIYAYDAGTSTRGALERRVRVYSGSQYQVTDPLTVGWHEWVVSVSDTSQATSGVVTGSSITPADSSITEGQSLTLTGVVQGLDSFNTAGTWTRESGATAFTTSGNDITISPTVGSAGVQSVFRFAPDGDPTLFTERTITITESSAFTQQDSAEYDVLALEIMAETMPELQDLSGWSTNAIDLSSPPLGVTVIDGRVARIKLNGAQGYKQVTPGIIGEDGVEGGYGLTGFIPEEIGWLTKCKYFNVKQNYLNTTIPDSIGYSGIKYLLLNGERVRDMEKGQSHHPGKPGQSYANRRSNIILGDVPASIGLLDLNVFECGGRGIEDYKDGRGYEGLTSIPPEMGNCTNLWGFHIGYNSVESIPVEMGACTQMVHYAILRNKLNGQGLSSWLGNCANLRDLWISYNQLGGPLPDLSGTSLRVFQSYNTEFTGPYPSYLTDGTLPNINMCHFPRNLFDGPIPDTFETVADTTLITYNIGYTKFVSGPTLGGEIPSTFWNNKSQIFFSFAGNDHTGDLLNLNLTSQRYDSNGNVIETGYFQLRHFQVQQNKLSGKIPHKLPNNPSTQKIYLYDNDFDDVDIETFQNIQSVYYDSSGTLVNAHPRRNVAIHFNKLTYKHIIPAITEFDGRVDKDGNPAPLNFKYSPMSRFGDEQNLTFNTGDPITLDFSIHAYTGNQYQWYRDNNPISGENIGENTHTLSILSASGNDNATYRLEITNPAVPDMETFWASPGFTTTVSGLRSNDINITVI